MDKGIGFNRTVKLDWLEAAANLRARTDDTVIIRRKLDSYLAQFIEGVEARRKTIDVLVNIWAKAEGISPTLHARALELLPETSEPHRLWLHYGLILVYYPFFRQCVAITGQIFRVRVTITKKMLVDRLAGQIGHLGSISRSAQHVMASLSDWNILRRKSRDEFSLVVPPLAIEQTEVQLWLLACALSAHPADELPFTDLINLPELFPFRFSITLQDLRRNDRFIIQRQGGWEMLRLR